jgi:hypothetical protein
MISLKRAVHLEIGNVVALPEGTGIVEAVRQEPPFFGNDNVIRVGWADGMGSVLRNYFLLSEAVQVVNAGDI